MEPELQHLEATLIALGTGPGHAWSRDHIVAHGCAAQNHQLAYALDHLMSNPNPNAYRQAKYALCGLLVSFRLCPPRDADIHATDGLNYWITGHCLSCSGSGLNHDQSICKECGGAGWIQPTEIQRRCKVLIEAAFERMERALEGSLKGWWPTDHHQPVRSFNPMASEYGTVTPMRPQHA